MGSYPFFEPFLSTQQPSDFSGASVMLNFMAADSIWWQFSSQQSCKHLRQENGQTNTLVSKNSYERCEGKGGERTMAIPLAPRQIQAIVKARQIPESRRGSSVSTSVCSGGCTEPPWCPTNSLLTHLFPLKTHNQSPRR